MVAVRIAAVGDERDVARVHVHSWRVGYEGLIPREILDQIRQEDRAARYEFERRDESSPLTIVASADREIVGFATLGSSRDPEYPNEGEIFALYVDPDHWGHGVGRALMRNARRTLRQRTCVRAHLWVLEGNLRATRFYEADGWTCDGRLRTDEVWGVELHQIHYRRELT